MHADGMLRAGPNEQLPWWVHGVKLQPFWRMFVFTFLACITLQWVVQRPVHAVMSTRVCARQGVASSHAGFPVATCLLEPWDGVNHVCSLIHREKQPFPFLSCFFFSLFLFLTSYRHLWLDETWFVKVLGSSAFCANCWLSEGFQIAVPSLQERFLGAMKSSFTICPVPNRRLGVCVWGWREGCAFRVIGKLEKSSVIWVHWVVGVSLPAVSTYFRFVLYSCKWAMTTSSLGAWRKRRAKLMAGRLNVWFGG